MKFQIFLILAIVLLFAACRKENVTHNEAGTGNVSAAVEDQTYFLNTQLSTTPQYIATKTHEQNTDEETTVYTTFQAGHIDSLYITMSKHARTLVQSMYANGIQVYFKSIHDSVGRVAIDLDGNNVSGISIPIRTVFNPVGSGYASGAVFKEALYSMRIAGVTYQDSVASGKYLLVGSKPQISLERTALIKNNVVDTLLTIDLTAISDFVVIQDIPLTSLLTNASIKASTLKAIDSFGKSVGTVSQTKQGTVTYLNIAVPNYFKVYPGTVTKIYLLGKISHSANWQAIFSLDKPQKFVWDDDTYKVFKGTSNATYLVQSGDYMTGSVFYP